MLLTQVEILFQLPDKITEVLRNIGNRGIQDDRKFRLESRMACTGENDVGISSAGEFQQR